LAGPVGRFSATPGRAGGAPGRWKVAGVVVTMIGVPPRGRIRVAGVAGGRGRPGRDDVTLRAGFRREADERAARRRLARIARVGRAGRALLRLFAGRGRRSRGPPFLRFVLIT
jgi:hypothetical protein